MDNSGINLLGSDKSFVINETKKKLNFDIGIVVFILILALLGLGILGTNLYLKDQEKKLLNQKNNIKTSIEQKKIIEENHRIILSKELAFEILNSKSVKDYDKKINALTFGIPQECIIKSYNITNDNYFYFNGDCSLYNSVNTIYENINTSEIVEYAELSNISRRDEETNKTNIDILWGFRINGKFNSNIDEWNK